jgi:hypothetical protein
MMHDGIWAILKSDHGVAVGETDSFSGLKQKCFTYDVSSLVMKGSNMDEFSGVCRTVAHTILKHLNQNCVDRPALLCNLRVGCQFQQRNVCVCTTTYYYRPNNLSLLSDISCDIATNLLPY